MKIPLLSRRLKNKTFHFEPRYYDEVKEDIKNRTARIASELKAEKEHGRSAFKDSAYFTRKKQDRSIDIMQVLLMALFLGTIMGWMYYGNVVLYIFLVLFPLYLFIRTRKRFR